MESQNYWRKKKMKKKVLLIALLVALILAPVTAASYRGSEKNGTFAVLIISASIHLLSVEMLLFLTRFMTLTSERDITCLSQ